MRTTLVLCSSGLYLRADGYGYIARVSLAPSGLVVSGLNRDCDRPRSYFLPLIARAGRGTL